MIDNEIDLAAALAAYRTTFDARQEALKARASAAADELLSPAWRRLLGPVWKLVRALMIQRVTAELEQGRAGGGHVFGTMGDLAELVGVHERTLRRWLDPRHPAARWVRAWCSSRTLYGSREDGGTCRVGTLWRVCTAVKAAGDDVLPAARPTMVALRAPWRTSDQLPSGTSACGTVSELSGQGLAGVITSRQGQGSRGQTIRVEGRDLDLERLADTVLSHTGHARGAPVATLANVRASSAWAAAEALAEKLGDSGSVAFWYGRFRAAQRGEFAESAIYGAAAQAIEQRDAGRLRKSAGAYAVGVLRRGEGMAA